MQSVYFFGLKHFLMTKFSSKLQKFQLIQSKSVFVKAEKNREREKKIFLTL